MSQPPDPTGAKQWLDRARGNLLRAGGPRPVGTFLEDFCFDAQQAAEKALKAVYVVRGIPFAWIHDIARLIKGLREAGVDVPTELDAAWDLTVYAVMARYPGTSSATITEADCQDAIRLAEMVIAWAASVEAIRREALPLNVTGPK